MTKKWNSLLVLLLLIAVVFAISGFGAVFTDSSVASWYSTLRKPSWNPPGWVFGPVWSTLYFMIAVSAWLVWRKRGFKGAAGAWGLFIFQLVLNAAWSPLFFGLQSTLAGLLDIVPLWAAILATMVVFWRISRAAGALLVPYWLWVSFAAVLNFTIWRMNR